MKYDPSYWLIGYFERKMKKKVANVCSAHLYMAEEMGISDSDDWCLVSVVKLYTVFVHDEQGAEKKNTRTKLTRARAKHTLAVSVSNAIYLSVSIYVT